MHSQNPHSHNYTAPYILIFTIITHSTPLAFEFATSALNE